jgi:hypothetical protein
VYKNISIKFKCIQIHWLFILIYNSHWPINLKVGIHKIIVQMQNCEKFHFNLLDRVIRFLCYTKVCYSVLVLFIVPYQLNWYLLSKAKRRSSLINLRSLTTDHTLIKTKFSWLYYNTATFLCLAYIWFSFEGTSNDLLV